MAWSVYTGERSGFLLKGIDAIEEMADGTKRFTRIEFFTPTGLIDRVAIEVTRCDMYNLEFVS